MTIKTGNSTRQQQGTKRQGIARYRLLAAVCFWAGFMAMGTAQAEEGIQSHDALQQSAQDFLEAQLASIPNDSADITLGHLDPRLRLKSCDVGLEPFLPSGAKLQGKLNVGIRCPDAWTIYLSANIKFYSEIQVAAHPLSRGDTVTAGDTVPQRMEVSKLNSGYYLHAEDVEGKILKRSIPAGRPLTPNMLKAPLLVRRGDAVTIIATSTGLQVRMKGKALEDAAYGERVSVQNLRSKRVVEGTAVEPGQVQVLM